MSGKKYEEAKKLVDAKKSYAVEEAVELVKQTSKAKFDATVELHLKLGIDPKKGEQGVRGTLSLPHGTGKSKKVAAFVSAEKEADAKAAGADIVGGEELVKEIIASGKADFDVAVATPDMMPKLAKAAKILGPKGLMPNPKTDTVGGNIKKMIEEQKAGKLSFKNDDGGNIHVALGKVSFDSAKLVANLNALLEMIKKARPASAKGVFIQNAVLTSTMGPAIRISVS